MRSEALRPELDAAIKAARDGLDWLDRSYALIADRSNISLSPDTGSRAQTLSETSGAAIDLGHAFIDLVGLGYHSETIPTYRASASCSASSACSVTSMRTSSSPSG